MNQNNTTVVVIQRIAIIRANYHFVTAIISTIKEMVRR